MRIRWTTRLSSIVAILAVIAAIDWYFGAFIWGATTRFLWNIGVWALFALARTIEAGALLFVPFMRRQGLKVTSALTAVGLGYASSVILTDEQVRRAHTVREKVRAGITRARNMWVALPFFGKLGFAASLVALQFYAVPSIAKMFVYFPIGFLIPFFHVAKRYVIVRAVDSVFGNVLRRFGRPTLLYCKERFRAMPIIREIRGGMLLLRLQYLTAWRMWKYDPCYRLTRGRRRISLFEPMRLWWRSELNRYVGKPLFSGSTYAREPSSYMPPPLWYEHERPFARAGMIIAASLITMFALTGSAKRRS